VIARNVGVGTSTVYRLKQRFVEEGLEPALNEKPRPGAARKLTASDEALLVATACSTAPKGRARWTCALLAERMAVLTEHERVPDETIRSRLKAMKIKPWQSKMWCIPAVDAEFVARMEDVLDLYAEPLDPRRPVVCFDETPRQLIGETRTPIPAEPGRVERFDYEYRRNATANLFVMVDAHAPWRHVCNHRQAHVEGLRASDEGTRRHSLPGRRQDSSRARQPLDPSPQSSANRFADRAR